jgi:PD-(D/E)XK endonuclease
MRWLARPIPIAAGIPLSRVRPFVAVSHTSSNRSLRRLKPRCYAPGRIRTCDPVLRRHVLYPLSYGRSVRQLSSCWHERLFVRWWAYGGVMNTLQRGDATEAALISALTDRGFEVLLPFSRSSAFDLGVALSPNRLLRIQRKCGRVRDGCVVFNTMGTDHGRGPKGYGGRADLFGVRCVEVGSTFLVPVAIAPISHMGLRLNPARNNQRSRIHYAADFEIARWTVERLNTVVHSEGAASG